MKKDASRIVADVVSSCAKHHAPDGLIDVVLASICAETHYNPMASDDRGSWGIYQVQIRTARLFLKRVVTPSELMYDVEENIDIGVRHQINLKTVQAYNAGERGILNGYGNHHAQKVLKMLQEMSWTLKDEDGRLNKKYMVWFDFSHPKKTRRKR